MSPELPPGRAPASGRRQLLAVYLDYLLFGGLWALVLWALGPRFAAVTREAVVAKTLVFAVVEIALVRFARWSPGNALLSIELPGSELLYPPGPSAARPAVPTVPERQLLAETWWTVLFGVVAILSGVKQAVRWTVAAPPTPWFGLELPAAGSAALCIAVGVLECLVGAAALRLRPAVLPLSAAVHGASIASAVLAYDLLPAWIAEYVTAWRAQQGLPASPADAAEAARWMPPFFVLLPVIALGWSVLVWRRARRPPAP